MDELVLETRWYEAGGIRSRCYVGGLYVGSVTFRQTNNIPWYSDDRCYTEVHASKQNAMERIESSAERRLTSISPKIKVVHPRREAQ